MLVAPATWIDLAAATTYRTMRDAQCKLNSCIEAGCIAVGLAQSYGYLCEPVPVAVRVLHGNAATVLPGPTSRRRDGFAGHLVVHYPGADMLVDLTADQFHSPERGLLVPAPLLMPVTRDALAAGIEVTLPAGTQIAYQEMADDVSWRALPAWRDSSGVTIAAARRRLDVLLSTKDRRVKTDKGATVGR